MDSILAFKFNLTIGMIIVLSIVYGIILSGFAVYMIVDVIKDLFQQVDKEAKGGKVIWYQSKP